MFHDSNGNGFGDMWWTDKCTYFSSIEDMQVDSEHVVLANPWHEVGPILERNMCGKYRPRPKLLHDIR